MSSGSPYFPPNYNSLILSRNSVLPQAYPLHQEKLHLHALLITLLASLTSLARATKYCSCRADSYRFDYNFNYINNGCADLSDDWCSTNCNVFGRSCRYCQYKPAGDPFWNSKEDLESLKSWCRQQSVTGLRGNTYHGILGCYPYSNIKTCRSCGGCDYRNNDHDKEPDLVQLAGNAHQESLTLDLDDSGFQHEKPAVIVKPLNASTEYQCLGITVAAAIAVAQDMADIFEPCRKTQVGIGRYEVDCNTAKAVGCMNGQLSGLAMTFDRLCDSYDGLAIDMSLSSH